MITCLPLLASRSPGHCELRLGKQRHPLIVSSSPQPPILPSQGAAGVSVRIQMGKTVPKLGTPTLPAQPTLKPPGPTA